MKSKENVTRCIACGRPLTDPVSVEKQIGPVCEKRRDAFIKAVEDFSVENKIFLGEGEIKREN